LLKAYGLPWMYWNIALKGRTVPFPGAVRPPAALTPALELK
jgi:hypothetical protein